ncbi:MAG: cobalt ECF transporter T component CbiQ [Thermodesulfovibrionales bacterium]|nr:cobalt ECF transporter T component CbiQ [Nitrospinota bacterium]MCG2710664.1 cobalt ECF transporter T component CbiQ [Thermodesulfovibrionales bacterium]
MTFDEEYFNIGYLDRLSYRDTVVHRLDPRGKVIATMIFVITVISYPKYEVIPLVPFFIFPVLLITLSDTPFKFVLKKMLIVSPFAVFIGIFNPLFDTRAVTLADGVLISAGWISFLSLLIKFTLTTSSALLLIATTSFPGICTALQRLGVPAPFTSQLFFLYRYIFVLMEEAMRIVRARDLRSFGSRGTDIKVFVRLIGILFVRTVERAERIYNAMLSRGFRGHIPSMRQLRFTISDAIFVFLTIAFLSALRFFNITEMIGRFVQELAV